MSRPEFDDFGEFFRQHILPDLIKHIDPALDHLRRKDPQEWLRIATELRKRGSYDRVERMREAEDATKELIELIRAGLVSSVPEFVRLHTIALEKHYMKHGLELDDLLRKSPAPAPMSARESVDAQIKAMGFTVDPTDKR